MVYKDQDQGSGSGSRIKDPGSGSGSGSGSRIRDQDQDPCTLQIFSIFAPALGQLLHFFRCKTVFERVFNVSFDAFTDFSYNFADIFDFLSNTRGLKNFSPKVSGKKYLLGLGLKCGPTPSVWKKPTPKVKKYHK